MSLISRQILITGAGSGVGRGIACGLAGVGRRLLLADLNREAAEETAATITSRGHTAVACALDVASADQVRELFATLGETGIDVLINNAGMQHVESLEEYPPDRWDQLLGVMLKGPFLLTQAALPGMRRRGFGRIVNIGSIHSLIASPFKSAYTAAKHGLLGLTRVTALETADVDITANLVCPAYVRTPLVEAQIRKLAEAHRISAQEVVDQIMLAPMPKRAFITVEEIAASVEFLISPAARNITGQAIVIDGGWTAK